MAMAVLLPKEKDREPWMPGETERALALQKPSKDGTLKVVEKGQRQDR